MEASGALCRALQKGYWAEYHISNAKDTSAALL